MMGVIASESGGQWVKEQLDAYDGRHFMVDGKEDLTTNVQFITSNMEQNGFISDGLEKDYKDIHIFPVEYFCPKQTTGEYKKTVNTYCESIGVSSWANKNTWKTSFLRIFTPQMRTRLILAKRKLFG